MSNYPGKRGIYTIAVFGALVATIALALLHNGCSTIQPQHTYNTPTTHSSNTPQASPLPPLQEVSESRVGLDPEIVKSTALGSSCARYNWKGRGLAPLGYVQGMALAFAHTYCRSQKPGDSIAGIIGKANGDEEHDALTAYGVNEPTVSGRIVDTYALGMGEGMRESSGCPTCGHDTTAGTETSLTAEAGTFQASYNSASASSRLPTLWFEYRNNTQDCGSALWSQDADCSGSCSSPATIGNGTGAQWQQFTKACPQFAAEWAMALFRVLKGQFGPLIDKEAEYRSECVAMFGAIKSLIDKNGCGDL